MWRILKQANNCNYEDDALVRSEDATIVREDVLNSNDYQFLGSSFSPDCQQDSVPTNLKYLVSMRLKAPCIKDQHSVESQSSFSNSFPGYTFQLKKKQSKGHLTSLK